MSIVFGTPTTGKRVLLEEARRDAERVLAADGDERVEPLARDVLEHELDAVLDLYGFVRDVPRIVPPRGRMPEIARSSSCWNLPSTRPRQPSRTPTTS